MAKPDFKGTHNHCSEKVKKRYKLIRSDVPKAQKTRHAILLGGNFRTIQSISVIDRFLYTNVYSIHTTYAVLSRHKKYKNSVLSVQENVRKIAKFLHRKL